MLDRQKAAQAVYEWFKTVPFLVWTGEEPVDWSAEKAAASVILDVASGDATVWEATPGGVRALASILAAEFLLKLTFPHDSRWKTVRYDVPGDLPIAEQGAQVVSSEILRLHPWLKGGGASAH